MIHVKIVTPRGHYKEFDASMINLVSTAGQLGILSNHMPLVTMLKISEMTFIVDGKREHYAISGGLFYFERNIATILCDAIEHRDDIDLSRALQAKERAEKRLESKDDNISFKRAELALKRAMNRINVVNG